MRSSLLPVIGAAALISCGSYRVAIPPPAPGISPAERVALFHEMKPEARTQLSESTDKGHTWVVVDRSLVLANSIVVYAPEDLGPLVGPESQTMRAARRSAGARRKSDIAVAAALVSAIGGFALLVASEDSPPWGIDEKFIWAGSFAVPLVFSGVARHYRSVELDERRAAFSHYTRDLGMRLNVCARGLEVIPCESAPASPAR